MQAATFIGRQTRGEMKEAALYNSTAGAAVLTSADTDKADAAIEAAYHVGKSGHFINFRADASPYGTIMGVVDLRALTGGENGLNSVSWGSFPAADLEAYCGRRLYRAWCEKVTAADKAAREGAN